MPSFSASSKQNDPTVVVSPTNNNLYQAFNMGNMGARLLAQGDSNNSFVFLTQALNLINESITTEMEQQDAGSNDSFVQPNQSQLMFNTYDIQMDNCNGLQVYNQAWVVGLRGPPPTGGLLSDSTSMMTAIMLLNLALHQHQLGEFQRAFMLYQKCTNLLESDAAVTLCRANYDLYCDLLLLASYNNQASIQYGQGNLMEANKLLDKVRTLHNTINAKKMQQQQQQQQQASSSQELCNGEAAAGAGAA